MKKIITLLVTVIFSTLTLFPTSIMASDFSNNPASSIIQPRTDGYYFWDVESKSKQGTTYGSWRLGPQGAGPGTISVNKEGDRQIGQNFFGPGELLQGKVSAFRDSLARVRFPGADVQQHRARRGLIVANAPVDVDTEQMRKNAHKNSFLRDALRPLAGGRAAVLFLV